MSYADLHRLNLKVRPLSGVKPPLGDRRSQFLASFTSTVKLLARELDMLDATHPVLEVDLRERDIRIDGLPRADARPASPAVAVSFESKHGPLRYATGEFDDWAANLRAIALGLEALRAVDRYGISRRGEQYSGYRQIAQTRGGFQSREQAQQWIEERGGYRDAARRLHPDNADTGDEDEFKKLQQARALVEAT